MDSVINLASGSLCFTLAPRLARILLKDVELETNFR